MENLIISFILGLSVMFFGMTAWLFFRRGGRLSDLGTRIERLFNEEQIFLNPDLKISDVAAAVGSNRTYVSSYFNREAASTFYDYVNGLRVRHACRLLRDTDWSVKIIAEKSGYNSPQAFIRVFTKTKGISPSDFRTTGCD